MRLILMLAVAAAALSGEAAAFDCAKAKTDTEKAICADPKVKAVDDAMSAAYDAALPKLAADQQAALKANQIAWLKTREDYCAIEEGKSECLIERTTQRLNFLTAKAGSGPGLSDPLLPFIVSKKQTKTTCAAEAAVHKFPSPKGAGETAFNAAVDALLKATEDENGTREVSPDYQYDCDWSLDAEMTYGSPDLVAEVINFYAYGGGAHGNYARQPLVVDLKSGKSPSFADIFPDSAKADLVKMCTDGIRAEKTKRYADVGDPQGTKDLMAGLDEEMKNAAEAIEAGVADVGHWIIYDDRAEVYFAPYEIGSYAEGDYTCPLPKDQLKKLAKNNAWIVP